MKNWRRIIPRMVPAVAAGAAMLALAGCAGPGAISGSSPNGPLFVEDFESGKLDPAIWRTEVNGKNIVEVQTEKAAHGKYALRVRCPAPSNLTWAFIMAQHLPAALRQHCFGRAYMFITPKPPARHTIFIMAGTTGFPFNRFEEVATANGKWQLTYVDLHPTGNNEDYHSGGAIPSGKWVCLEWEFNDHPNHTTIWVDGEKIYETDFASKVTKATTDLVGGFDEFAFGFRLWGAAPEAFDVYYDDIALDTKRIGMEIKN